MGLAQSAAWPSKPLRLVVPFASGGSSEIVARAVAGEMAKTIGQNVFVDNKPGAAGNIAMQEVANSTDDHTLILGHIGTLAVNPYIFPKLPYDVARDFAPITLVSDVPTVAEQGFKGFEMTQWYGLMAPTKWAKAHLAKLEAEAIKATRSTIVQEKLSHETALAVGNTSAEFEAFIKSEQARWKPVIARANQAGRRLIPFSDRQKIRPKAADSASARPRQSNDLSYW